MAIEEDTSRLQAAKEQERIVNETTSAPAEDEREGRVSRLLRKTKEKVDDFNTRGDEQRNLKEREKRYTTSDYKLNYDIARTGREREEAFKKAGESDDIKNFKTYDEKSALYDKLVAKKEARERDIDSTIYAERAIKKRDEPSWLEQKFGGFLEEDKGGSKTRWKRRSEGISTAGVFGSPSTNVFGFGNGMGGMPVSDMFGVGNMGSPRKSSVPNGFIDMFAVAPRKRTSGRMPRGSQPSGYDGSYDIFGVGNMGRSVPGADMFGFGNVGGAPARGKKPRSGGNAMRPNDMFGNVDIFGHGGMGGGISNPFTFGAPRKKSTPKRRRR